MPKSSQQVRELVDSLHPRNPKEVMGEVASSSLVGSTITAGIATLVLLFAATLIVFLIGGGPEEVSEVAATTTASPVAETTEPTPVASADTVKPQVAETAENEQAEAANAVEAMGIGETKDPDSQPETLESRLDQLLEGLE